MDEERLTQLVLLHDADLIRFCYLISGDVDLARDAVQSTWQRVWAKPPQLRDDRKMRSWLLIVAANEARQVMRRRVRGAALEQRAFRVDTHDGTAADLLDMRAALRTLDEDDRTLLALRYALELDSNEIADILNLSAEGVRSRLHRLIGRLRRTLGAD